MPNSQSNDIATARVDKYLWAVRLFKTRSLAAEACKKGQVLVNGAHVKPSRTLKGDEILSVKKHPIWRKYQMKQILNNRVGAKLVEEYIEDITPQEELDKLKLNKEQAMREKGAGRPTKRERRKMDKWKNQE